MSNRTENKYRKEIEKKDNPIFVKFFFILVLGAIVSELGFIGRIIGTAAIVGSIAYILYELFIVSK